MVLQFKIGNEPIVRHRMRIIPAVGSTISLPRSHGGFRQVRIKHIVYTESNKLSEAIFHGEWL